MKQGGLSALSKRIKKHKRLPVKVLYPHRTKNNRVSGLFHQQTDKDTVVLLLCSVEVKGNLWEFWNLDSKQKLTWRGKACIPYGETDILQGTHFPSSSLFSVWWDSGRSVDDAPLWSGSWRKPPWDFCPLSETGAAPFLSAGAPFLSFSLASLASGCFFFPFLFFLWRDFNCRFLSLSSSWLASSALTEHRVV